MCVKDFETDPFSGMSKIKKNTHIDETTWQTYPIFRDFTPIHVNKPIGTNGAFGHSHASYTNVITAHDPVINLRVLCNHHRYTVFVTHNLRVTEAFGNGNNHCLNINFTIIKGVCCKNILVERDLLNLKPILRVPQFPHFSSKIYNCTPKAGNTAK